MKRLDSVRHKYRVIIVSNCMRSYYELTYDMAYINAHVKRIHCSCQYMEIYGIFHGGIRTFSPYSITKNAVSR